MANEVSETGNRNVNKCPLHFIPPKDGVSPQDVRIRQLSARPMDDHKRIQFTISLTNFLSPPDLIISLKDAHRKEVASMILIENPTAAISHHLHIKSAVQLDGCTLDVQVSYRYFGIVDQKSIAFKIMFS